MMKFKYLFASVLAVFSFALSSCKVNIVPSITTTAEGTTALETTTEESDVLSDYRNIRLSSLDSEVPRIASIEDVTYEDLFNLGNRVEISLDIEESELEKLEEDYEVFKETWAKSEVYHIARSVTIKLTNYDNTFTWTYDDVGIRQKGNTSRNAIVNEDGSLNINHFKLSFDETFDSDAYGDDKKDWSGREDEKKEREDREFLGLSGLDLKWNTVGDESHIRELYASKMYQAAGLITQYIGLTTFTINRVDKNESSYMGVFLLYEPATKSMIKRHLKNEDILDFGSWKEEKNGTYGAAGGSYGDLYRMAWSADLSYDTMYEGMIGYASEDGTYSPTYDCKTNEGIEYDHELLKKLGYAVKYGNYANIEEHLDMRYFAATEAVSYLVGNPDDLRNDENNTMVYLRRSDGKAITIPVDNDRAFGITSNWNPDSTGMTAKTIFDTKQCTGENDVFSIYTKTILADQNNYSKQMYLNYIKAFSISGWCDGTYFTSLYKLAEATYKDYVKCDYYYADFYQYALNANEYSFYSYMELKLKNVDLSLDLGDVVTMNKEDIHMPESMEGYYGELYICGDFNSWKGKEYPFTYLGNGIYTITFDPGAIGDQWYKIYDGGNWRINWSIVAGRLIMKDISAQALKDLKKDSSVTITINTINKTGEITVE